MIRHLTTRSACPDKLRKPSGSFNRRKSNTLLFSLALWPLQTSFRNECILWLNQWRKKKRIDGSDKTVEAYCRYMKVNSDSNMRLLAINHPWINWKQIKLCHFITQQNNSAKKNYLKQLHNLRGSNRNMAEKPAAYIWMPICHPPISIAKVSN